MMEATEARSATTILVVDDELLIAKDLQMTLRRLGYAVPAIASSGARALQLADELRPDLILMDINLGGSVDGIDVATELRRRTSTPVVYLTAYADDETVRRAQVTEPFGYIIKPFNERELRSTVEIAVYKHACEARLRARERWFATTLRSIADGVVTTDAAGSVTFQNAAAERIAGAEVRLVDAATGEPLGGLAAAAIAARAVTPLPEGAAAVLATGELEPVAGSVAPILHESGHTFGAVLVFREVGQLRRAEQELRASEERLRSLNVHLERRVEERTAELVCANEALVRASRVKDSFLATMNHELRTPLNAVLGLSEALEEGVYGDLQQQQLRAIGRIDEAGRHLLSLIGDILDLSRLEADRDHIAVESVGARDIAEQSVRLVEASAQRKGQRLSLRTDGAPETLQANARTLKQILVNLLGNAIKFTPDGGAIELAVTADEGAGIVRFVVRDDGPGIAPEDLARIFDPFVQVDNRLARTHAGSGLGLALARRFAAAHGGQVTVESTVDVGSSFTLALPAGVGAASVGPGAGAAGGVTVPGPRLPP